MKKRNTWIAFGVLGFAGFVILAMVFWPRPRLLLPLSHRVIPPLKFSSDTNDLAWISDHTALIFRKDKNGKNQVTRLNLTTLTNLPDDKLTELYQKSSGIPTVFPSPDGQWLLWHGYKGKDLYLAATDGTHYSAFPVPHGQKTSWLDNRHWISNTKYLSENDTLNSKVYSVDDPQHPQIRSAFNLSNLPDYSNIAFLDQEHFLSDDWQQGEAAAIITVTEFEVGDAHRPLNTTKIPLPKNDLVYTVSYSPRAERIAFLLLRNRLEPISELIHRLISSYAIKTNTVVSLYVCNRDGKEMKEIGMIMSASGATAADELDIDSLRWFPDGKQLSYAYKGEVYTVLID